MSLGMENHEGITSNDGSNRIPVDLPEESDISLYIPEVVANAELMNQCMTFLPVKDFVRLDEAMSANQEWSRSLQKTYSSSSTRFLEFEKWAFKDDRNGFSGIQWVRNRRFDLENLNFEYKKKRDEDEVLGQLVLDKNEDMATYYVQRSKAKNHRLEISPSEYSYTLIEASNLGYLTVVTCLVKRVPTFFNELHRTDNKNRSALWFASLEGHLSIVEVLLTVNDMRVNQGDEEGKTPLHVATVNQHLPTVQALLAADADVNVRDNKDKTPLHVAIMNRHLPTVEALLAADADVNLRYYDGKTLLHRASEDGQKDIVNALLAARKQAFGLDVDVKDGSGKTPLHMASLNGHVEVVKALLGAKASVSPVDNEGKTPLHMASLNGRMKVVKALLGAKASVSPVDNERKTPLYRAFDKGHVKVVEALISALAEVKENKLVNQRYGRRRKTLLHRASEDGQMGLVNALLAAVDLDVDVKDGSGKTPLYLATEKGHVKVVRVLLLRGAALSRGGGIEAPLILAFKRKDLEVVRLILRRLDDHAAGDEEAKPGLDLTNGRKLALQWAGHLALQWACHSGLNKFVGELIRSKKVELDDGDAAPLLLASEQGHTDVTNVLLAAKVDVNQACEDGQTPLLKASSNGHVRVVNALLKAGAECNKADTKGNTPLDLACRNGHLKVVMRLLEAMQLIKAKISPKLKKWAKNDSEEWFRKLFEKEEISKQELPELLKIPRRVLEYEQRRQKEEEEAEKAAKAANRAASGSKFWKEGEAPSRR